MEEEITASMTFDVPTMKRAFIWHRRRRLQSRKWLFAAAVAMILISVVMDAQTDGWGWKPHYVVLMAALVFVIFARRLTEWSFCRSIRSSSTHGQVIRYIFGKDGSEVAMPNGDARLAWGHFRESVLTTEGVLLYPQQNIFNWLPKSAFNSETAYQRFIELVTANTKHSRVG